MRSSGCEANGTKKPIDVQYEKQAVFTEELLEYHLYCSFKHKCFSLFRTNHIKVTSSAVRIKSLHISVHRSIGEFK